MPSCTGASSAAPGVLFFLSAEGVSCVCFTDLLVHFRRTAQLFLAHCPGKGCMLVGLFFWWQEIIQWMKTQQESHPSAHGESNTLWKRAQMRMFAEIWHGLNIYFSTVASFNMSQCSGVIDENWWILLSCFSFRALVHDTWLLFVTPGLFLTHQKWGI